MKLPLTLAGTAALVAVSSGVAYARPVTITAQLADYGGYPAFLAVYIVNKAGAYQETLWVAGQRTSYYRHLRDWYRGAMRSNQPLDGVTGASVGSGNTLRVQANLSDVLINAGYRIQVDSAVEGGPAQPAEVSVPLDSAGAGKPVSGRGIIRRFTVSF
ncbi:DUF2271 domain-containing protein [Allorhizobium sp. BGMRC 0089]|uniref:DUF2271 domain-containing protein n=1 Tax=Allorhizobium sonneratiae TaxID=2934936 RepID=UPI0020338DD6|nr:DUF2271 domain-containing protein [Allorhizobium sonneratiae]